MTWAKEFQFKYWVIILLLFSMKLSIHILKSDVVNKLKLLACWPLVKANENFFIFQFGATTMSHIFRCFLQCDNFINSSSFTIFLILRVSITVFAIWKFINLDLYGDYNINFGITANLHACIISMRLHRWMYNGRQLSYTHVQERVCNWTTNEIQRLQL